MVKGNGLGRVAACGTTSSKHTRTHRLGGGCGCEVDGARLGEDVARGTDSKAAGPAGDQTGEQKAHACDIA